MPAAGALVDVTAEQGGSAGDDGGQDLQVQPGEPFPAAFEEAGSGCADQVGHLQWWPRHLFRGERRGVQGAGQVNLLGVRAKELVPAARNGSPPPSGGRDIYFAASESASRGLAVAPI